VGTFLATSGGHQLAITGDFFVAMDTESRVSKLVGGIPFRSLALIECWQKGPSPGTKEKVCQSVSQSKPVPALHKPLFNVLTRKF
jgi:hypothetical protein